MRKVLLATLMVVVSAAVLPTVATSALQNTSGECRRGVVVEGRCLSLDGLATACDGATCIEFVGESVPICPDGTITIEPDPGTDPALGPICELQELAAQRPPDCPEGARGEVGACFIYRAIGPAGCFASSVLDETNNCRFPVQDASGAFFCEREAAVLDGTDCTTIVDAVPSPCLGETSRIDEACWQLNGLTTPESCDGHMVAGTAVLTSGRCQVPLAIPSGPSTCVDPASYREGPAYLVISSDGQVQGEGPTAAACLDDVVPAGAALRYCFFPDDDRDWGSTDTNQCELRESPLTASCPAGFSIDDSADGTCWRFEEPTIEGCADGGIEVGTWCAFMADFEVFDCPDETDRHPQFPYCVAYQPWQGALSCADTPVQPTEDLTFGLPFGCFEAVGPQPERCNGLGTIESCYELREPAPIACVEASGCVGLGDFRILGDVSCDADVSLLDALMIAQHAALARTSAATCQTVNPATSLFTFDGDIDGDQTVGNADAQLLLEGLAAGG